MIIYSRMQNTRFYEGTTNGKQAPSTPTTPESSKRTFCQTGIAARRAQPYRDIRTRAAREIEYYGRRWPWLTDRGSHPSVHSSTTTYDRALEGVKYGEKAIACFLKANMILSYLLLTARDRRLTGNAFRVVARIPGDLKCEKF